MRLLIGGALTLALLCSVCGAAEARGESPPPPGAANGLASTPPMGWNSWNKFGCNVNEQTVRAAADAMVSTGMRDAGYQYVVIDDCWQGARDEHGDIQPDPQRFPSGMKALGDYIHARGLKFGIYSDAGEKTCGGRPGSWGHEYQDAAQYARWGVDYLKYDWCNTGATGADLPAHVHQLNPVSAYLLMSQALQATGRPIVFSLCEWGNSEPWLWARNLGNLWRTTGDIADVWEGHPQAWNMGVMNIIDMQVGLESFSGPGHWNDPDMLEVGNGGMSDSEYRAHFSLWALLAAPLIAGNDLAAMSAETRAILLNRDVIAVDQDPLGQQGRRVWKDGDLEVWARPLAGGGRAVVLLNRAAAPHPITVTWEQLNYPARLSMRVRDLWAHRGLGNAAGRFTATAPGHGVVMIRLDP
ncbi:MAG TPA: glycoside hydrolase family 27 protein [Caulobacterales bacterium]|nr:glycoside hydrolase family 27 protein [Caulobacterales bacterium]